jgi:hypothetical protein
MSVFNANQGKPIAIAFLRLSLAVGLLVAVAARTGLWRGHGLGMVSWNWFANALAYSAKFTPGLPQAFVPFVGWAITITEGLLGLALLTGFQVPRASLFTGCLLLLFAIAMSFSVGILVPVSFSVFIAAAGAFVLATL